MTHAARDVVVITGAAQGIGLHCALLAAEAGASVAILDVNAAAADRAAASLPGGPHLAVAGDVTDRASMDAAIAEVAATIGPPTAVVAAAGIVSRTPLADATSEEFRRVFAVNVEGVHHTIAAAVPHLRAAGARGSIVALGSVAAATGGGLMGNGVYAMSKAAVEGLVRGYARELAPWGVRANVVAPGATETPMTSVLSDEDVARITSMSLLGRMCRPEEIAGVVTFLLGGAAGAITGQVLRPNGGVVFG